MKDAYSFHVDEDGRQARVPEHVRRLHAHLHALRARVPRRRGRHRRDRRLDCRTSSRCWPSPARTRIVACDNCDYAANVEKAEVARVAERRAPPAERARWRRCTRPASRRIDDVSAFLKAAADALRQDARSTSPTASRSRSWCAAIATSTRSSCKKALGADELRAGHRRRGREVTGAPVGFAGPGRLQGCPIYADLEVRGDGRLRHRRQRGRRAPDRRQPRPRLHADGHGRLPRRPPPATPARAARRGTFKALPRHRGRPRLLPRHEVLEADEGATSSTPTARRSRW